MKQIAWICLLIFPMFSAIGQTAFPSDTVETLETVIIRAYESNRRLIDIPAPVTRVNNTQLNRFNNITILPAMNTVAGVRMEERSPGSYRLNIRGSSLRSPFGIRNVKVYWNEIPFTDPGGNTYLNQLGFQNIHSIEVIKGPAGSLYGAGTGGAVLLKTVSENWKPGVAFGYSAGSFNTHNIDASAQFGRQDFQNTIQYVQQKSDGYRAQSNMNRKVFSYETNIKAAKNDELKVLFLYGDLFYQTPGGLNKAQYEANEKAARPAAGMFPGAEEAHAAIYQKTLLAGLSNNYRISGNLEHVVSLYGAFSQIKNPTIRNYERRNEPHFGGRTLLRFHPKINESKLNFIIGGELQQGYSNIKVYNNVAGTQDTLHTDDEVDNLQYFAFAQAELELKTGWIFTAAASLNKLKVAFYRSSNQAPFQYQRNYSNELAPRVSVLKKINPNFSMYAGISKGFSPPTVGELLPSTSIINTSLDAEHGTNYELGARGSFFHDRLFVDISAFTLTLKNALVQRRDVSGADYFENAGSARQKGLESHISYQLIKRETARVPTLSVFISHTWHRFRYKDYKQLDNEFSGNEIPGVAEHVVATGLDLNTNIGVYTNINYYYSDPIPLNDANSEYASSYNLLGARVGYKKRINSRFAFDLFGAVDNIFDTKYSLGNDINAAVGRYYNAAAGVNYVVGIRLNCD